jgi:serine/threonine-protein kinase
MVMELLRGDDLRSLLDREGALPIPRAVSLVWEACQGIAAVHAQSLVHRDLKPENLFVSKRTSGADWCKVLDFGVAKTDVSSSTVEGAVMGTVRYMAPEQLQDAASAGPAVDIYALAAVLYECLTGSSPHQGSTVQELMFKILNEQAPRLDSVRAGVPKGLADAVERALAKSKASRFADVQHFARAIAPFARPASAEDIDTRATTVDLEDDSSRGRSERASSNRGYFALVLSGVLGVVAGFSLRTPATAAPARARVAEPLATQPSPATQHAPASSGSVSAPGVHSPVPVTSASAPESSDPSPQKARVGAAARRPAAAPRIRFDSENPYGR